ncbi:MAG: ectoine hydrolase DoeA [Acidimicrobiaceae bacterium]|jgi:ectoine hydrolase|nr:ectoine hydrolase DoeA [Acidimicrobiaceae bacterium]MBT5581855.1 ectoine hydrolase DoeA [Acidimicrobiaceae bacterium]MBT5850499.1 ectoine hydrolase DoeA [Acidimicrobiaceae bacterium]
MSDAIIHFGRDEYATRLAATRAAMAEQSLDTLIVHDPSNMSWLTGYDGWSFYTPQCVIVGGTGDPVWFGRGMDANGAKRTTYLSDDDIIGYPDHYVMSTERHAMDYLATTTLSDRGWATGRIGVEFDNYYYSARAHARLVEHVPNATIVDATSLVNWLRLVKSPREIDYMRIAGTIVTQMHQRILELMEPGIRKNDLVAEIYHTGIRGTPEHGGDYPAIVPMMPTGEDASAAHLTWDDRELVTGEGSFFEVAGVYRRYHVPLSRTIHLGPAPASWLAAEEALLSSIEAGLRVVTPGNTFDDMHRAFIADLRSYGYDKESRAGYGIGLSYPPDWGERNISIRPGELTEMKPGMTFHFMPALWQDDWGLEITESVLVTETGYELLADVPRKLFVKS